MSEEKAIKAVPQGKGLQVLIAKYDPATDRMVAISSDSPLPASTELATVSQITKDGKTSLYVVSGFTETYTVHMDVQSVVLTTAFMLIDLSNASGNWKHTETGHINLEYLIIEVDPDTSFLGEIKLGFLTNVDAINGDFNQVIDIDMIKKSDLLVENLNFGSHGMDLQTSHHFGPMLVDSVLFRTGLDLGGPDDPAVITYPSGDGDLILLIERSAGEVDVSVTLGYETAD